MWNVQNNLPVLQYNLEYIEQLTGTSIQSGMNRTTYWYFNTMWNVQNNLPVLQYNLECTYLSPDIDHAHDAFNEEEEVDSTNDAC